MRTSVRRGLRAALFGSLLLGGLVAVSVAAGGASAVTTASAGAPQITTQPLSQSGPLGSTLTFSAAASGSPAPTVQWQVSTSNGVTWTNVPGWTSTTETTGALSSAANGWEVRAVLTNTNGTATSNTATITVAPTSAVVIPANNAAVAGTRVVLDAGTSPEANSVLYELSGEGLTNQVIATATPTTYGWVATWDSTSVPNGIYSIRSVASYSAAGSGASLAITVNVNNPAPTTTVTIPTDNVTLSSSNTTVLDAVASSGVTQVQFDISALGMSPTIITATPTLFGWIVILPAGPSGDHFVPIGISVQSVASYSGGVSGTSPPVNFTLDLVVTSPQG
jgi:large repetitive protein